VSDLSIAADIAASPAWISRVLLAVTDAAVDILSEDENVAAHDVRVRLARGVIRGDSMVLTAWPRLVLTNETVRSAVVADAANAGANVPDGDIQFTVASLWTNVARSLLNTY
jgi:hypothetical protein